MPTPPNTTINSVSVPVLLDWWQKRKRVASAHSTLHSTLPKGDETYLKAYYRLMEIYSVVKSGGIKAQIEAVHAFSERESDLLNQRLSEVAADPQLAEDEKAKAKEQIEQELDELRSANEWRLQALTNITSDEESVVSRYLTDIEQTLMQAKCA